MESNALDGPKEVSEKHHVNQNFEEYKNAQTIREYFGPFLNGKHAIRLSKFIHNNLVLNTSYLIRGVFIVPFLVQMVILFAILYRESTSIKNFQKIGTEIAILDANGHMQRVCKLHLYYVGLSRMYFDGKVSDSQFDKFGFSGTYSHLASLQRLPIPPSQMTLNMFRMDMKLKQSSYWRLHDAEWLQRSTVKVKVYDETSHSFSFEDMPVFDAARDTQRRLDVMFGSANDADTLFGVRRNRNESIEEQLVSYNALNPLSTFFDQRRQW